MTAVWTHGTWVVRPGHEAEFVTAWTELARSDAATTGGRPFLLRDRDRPNVFISAGPWPTVEAIEAFRVSDAFKLAGERIGPLLEDRALATLDEVDWA
jgi:heme-degrading monooxygenase HmoA